MRGRQQGRTLIALTVGGALALTACGGSDDSGGGSGGSGKAADKAPIIVGTTDTVTSLDPAGSYDLGSWTIIYNTYQNLLRIPPGGNTPTPDAAKSCDFTSETTYTCTMNDGLSFSNGDPLTAKDAAFSIQRVLDIADASGPSSLFGAVKSVSAPDEKTVTFELNKADATFPFVLTTGGAAIVDSKVFPADKLLASDKVIGSGPYQLDKYAAGQQAVLKPNDAYSGEAELANSTAVVQYYDQASALKLAIEQGDVDVAYRSLSPTDIEALRGESDRGVQIVEGQGTEIRYMTFNVTTPPADQKPVRQAVAASIDRAAIAKNAYNDTVTPLYSMIPQGLEGATKSFADAYGTSPDLTKAKAILTDAGVTTPAPITIWWTPSHYGPNSADEYTEIKRQLDATGLFTVTLQSSEWQQYQKQYAAGQFPAFELGWFPDFPDADNYTAPFLVDGGFFKNNYSNPTINDLVATEETSTDPAVRKDAFAKIQDITAQDVPVLPIWQGKQQAAVRDGVTGVKDTFDPSFTFRFWLVGKSAS